MEHQIDIKQSPKLTDGVRLPTLKSQHSRVHKHLHTQGDLTEGYNTSLTIRKQTTLFTLLHKTT